MPTFAYTARDGNGVAISGTISAASEAEASTLLRRESKYPISILPARADGSSSTSSVGTTGIKISRADVIQISQQLAIMVETGVTITEALECIATQSDKPKVKALVEDLQRQVQSGVDFSTALSRHDRSFPQLYIALIRASEKSGMMGKLLVRATHYLRDEQETVRRVKGAMIYPAIMLVFAIKVTIFLLIFVLPKFTSIYAAKAAALPVPTKILMNISDFLVTHYIMLPIGLILLVGALFAALQTQVGRRVSHYLQLNTPVIGGVFCKLHLSRSLRMIGTMAGAGVPLVECVTTANDLCTNSYFKQLWTDVLNKIQSGRQLCEPLFESNLVPRSVSQMIHSGEKSGKLSFVMEQIAGFAETELKEKIAEMTRYIEPAMIIVMGVIIGSVALALLLPIFTISRVMSH
ncbi:MAG TPA: type II secretion system F family protein [Tepidisphaeraceae bacterium]|jgi:type IV pilus assembly protein PilC